MVHSLLCMPQNVIQSRYLNNLCVNAGMLVFLIAIIKSHVISKFVKLVTDLKWGLFLLGLQVRMDGIYS